MQKLIVIKRKWIRIDQFLQAKSTLLSGIDISTITIRISVFVLLIFLIQTFSTIFRYTMRLAAFYEARSDAIALCSGTAIPLNTGNLLEVVRCLSPESYDFGRPPKLILNDAIDLAKAALTRAGTGASGR